MRGGTEGPALCAISRKIRVAPYAGARVRFFSHALPCAMEARALSNLLAIARVGVASTSSQTSASPAPPPPSRHVGAALPPAFRPRGQVVLRAGRQPPARAAATALDLPNVFEETEEEGVEPGGVVDPAVDRDVERPTQRWYANSGKAHTYEVREFVGGGCTAVPLTRPWPPGAASGRQRQHDLAGSEAEGAAAEHGAARSRPPPHRPGAHAHHLGTLAPRL